MVNEAGGSLADTSGQANTFWHSRLGISGWDSRCIFKAAELQAWGVFLKRIDCETKWASPAAEGIDAGVYFFDVIQGVFSSSTRQVCFYVGSQKGVDVCPHCKRYEQCSFGLVIVVGSSPGMFGPHVLHHGGQWNERCTISVVIARACLNSGQRQGVEHAGSQCCQCNLFPVVSYLLMRSYLLSSSV